ncbi:cytochrome c biogenesis protein ResB [bacterium]|nr:cytochrome c biogenesis protein ResB [bacterium]
MTTATKTTETKGAERTPVIRPRASKEELAKLHPIERFLYRVFEFFSSLKLAIILMVWLMIECAIGTRVESTINASAAKYFVYWNTRFHILLALLALNVFFAAMIRFPWKRYQTGFVVTHAGLLLILAGSMLTSISYIDSLLNVRQGEIADTMINPDRDVINVQMEDPSTGNTKSQRLLVEFGPLTWGSKILGWIPWGKGYEKVYKLDELQKGATLRIKRFIAHSDWRETYLPDKIGVPAVEFTLSAPDAGNFEQTTWFAAKATELGFIGDERVSVGGIPVQAKLWRAGSQAELDHFVQAAPKGEIPGPIGAVGFSYAGKHVLLNIDELQKKPFEDPQVGVKVEFVNYMPHAELDRATRQWKNVDDDPVYPALQLNVTSGDKKQELILLAAHPELTRALSSRLPDGYLMTFFRADQPTELQLLVTMGEQLGYRAFSNQSCLTSVVAKMDETYPSFGIFKFIPRRVVASGRPDLEIIPKPVPPGQETFPAVEAELALANGTKTTVHLVRRLPDARTFLDGQIVRLGYDIDSEPLPFAIRLDDFNEPKQPGTMSAARYESFVTVFDKKDIPRDKFDSKNPLMEQRGDRTVQFDEVRKAEIKMNHPLFYKGEDGREYTLYQSGINRVEGTPVSTFTVAYDPGLIVKYIGAVVLCAGIFLMFYMGGYFKRKPVNQRQSDDASIEDDKPEMASVT